MPCSSLARVLTCQRSAIGSLLALYLFRSAFNHRTSQRHQQVSEPHPDRSGTLSFPFGSLPRSSMQTLKCTTVYKCPHYLSRLFSKFIDLLATRSLSDFADSPQVRSVTCRLAREVHSQKYRRDRQIALEGD